MSDSIDINIILNYLKRNYPVYRIKHEFRFKRAIILDNGSTYQLSNELQYKALKHDLGDIIKVVFNCDDKTNKTIINKYLP